MAEGDGQGPKYFTRSTAFIVGLTGLILAVVGLLAALGTFRTSVSDFRSPSPSSFSGPTTDASTNVTAEVVTNAVNPTSNVTAAGEQAAAALPTLYSKPNGFLMFLDGQWTETDQSAGTNVVYQEVSRGDGTINGTTTVFDSSRNLYMRWPTNGGTVQWSLTNPMEWRDLYIVTPVNEEQGAMD